MARAPGPTGLGVPAVQCRNPKAGRRRGRCRRSVSTAYPSKGRHETTVPSRCRRAASGGASWHMAPSDPISHPLLWSIRGRRAGCDACHTADQAPRPRPDRQARQSTTAAPTAGSCRYPSGDPTRRPERFTFRNPASRCPSSAPPTAQLPAAGGQHHRRRAPARRSGREEARRFRRFTTAPRGRHPPGRSARPSSSRLRQRSRSVASRPRPRPSRRRARRSSSSSARRTARRPATSIVASASRPRPARTARRSTRSTAPMPPGRRSARSPRGPTS